MILHLVTDRRRLAPAAAPSDATACVVEQARFAIDAGIDVIQVRERDLDVRDLMALVVQVVALARGSRTRVVVNERLDVALAAGADGVHLPARALPASEARRLAPPGFLVGRSVHSLEEASVSEGADYLVAGTVWPSASKPGRTKLLGVEGMAAIVRASTVPVLGIGGITLGRVREIVDAGVAGIAAIGLFVGDPVPGRCGAAPLDTLTQRLRSFPS